MKSLVFRRWSSSPRTSATPRLWKNPKSQIIGQRTHLSGEIIPQFARSGKELTRTSWSSVILGCHTSCVAMGSTSLAGSKCLDGNATVAPKSYVLVVFFTSSFFTHRDYSTSDFRQPFRLYHYCYFYYNSEFYVLQYQFTFTMLGNIYNQGLIRHNISNLFLWLFTAFQRFMALNTSSSNEIRAKLFTISEVVKPASLWKETVVSTLMQQSWV